MGKLKEDHLQKIESGYYEEEFFDDIDHDIYMSACHLVEALRKNPMVKSVRVEWDEEYVVPRYKL